MADLKGKTLFITGGTRGIGLAIALRAARDGANVVDRREDHRAASEAARHHLHAPPRRSRRPAARRSPYRLRHPRRGRR